MDFDSGWEPDWEPTPWENQNDFEKACQFLNDSQEKELAKLRENYRRFLEGSDNERAWQLIVELAEKVVEFDSRLAHSKELFIGFRMHIEDCVKEVTGREYYFCRIKNNSPWDDEHED